MSLGRHAHKRSLINLVIALVSIVLALVLLGSLLLNISSTRNLLQQQLYSHAQDSATSLGLSLSTVVDADDDVLAGRMIDAIFDSGDFNRVIYFGVDGRTRISKRQEDQNAGVPDWFVSSVNLQAPMAEAQVMSGWTQLGKLVVQSSTGHAYRELWSTLKDNLIWFSLVLLCSLLATKMMLARLLAPLRLAEQQAHAISAKDFSVRVGEPSTRELANVAEAMNEMADSLGGVFDQQLNAIERLREQSLLDFLTGLLNRDGFDRRLKTELEAQSSAQRGTLMLLKVKDFERFNQEVGREQADELLIEISQSLKKFLEAHHSGFAARRSGADFSIYLPDLSGDAVDSDVAKLMSMLSALPGIRQSLQDDLLHIGVACAGDIDGVGRLLSKADLALRSAQAGGVSGWQRYAGIADASLKDEVLTANSWHQALKQALTSEGVALYLQDVVRAGDQSLLFEQAMARLEVEGELIEAGKFLPMAKRFRLMPDLDRLMIDQVLSVMAERTVPMSVSISEQSLQDESFFPWFEARLGAVAQDCSQLFVQVPEYALKFCEKGMLLLSQVLSSHGAKLIIERFGVSSAPFSYLHRFKVEAIKVDRSFIRGVDGNIENQFFLGAALQLARSKGVQVIAVGVETQSELDTLLDIGVDGVMGYLLSRPQSL